MRIFSYSVNTKITHKSIIYLTKIKTLKRLNIDAIKLGSYIVSKLLVNLKNLNIIAIRKRLLCGSHCKSSQIKENCRELCVNVNKC